MPYTNFLGDGIAVNGAPVLPGGGALPIARRYFYVDSAVGLNGNPGTMEAPFSTLDYAIGQCAANKGDVIIVLPNHAETITGAGGITADVAGITIIGVGRGDQRPRFLMDGGTAVTFLVSAADVSVENCVFAAGHADIVTCFNITDRYCTLRDCEFVQHVTDENFVTPIKATGGDNTADGLTVERCRFMHVDAASAEFVEITGNIDDFRMIRNYVCCPAGTATPLFLQAGAKVMTDVLILGNFLQNGNTANDIAFDNGGSGNSGIIAYNLIGHADVTGAHALGAVAGCRFFENRSTSVDNLSGLLLPAADVDL
jgi:hypothetical protein